MEKNCGDFDAARIERGAITEAVGTGYRVASYGRAPLVTPPLKPLFSGVSFTAGDQVFFFLFDDGDGRILGKF